MLFVIIILLCIIASASIGINIKYYGIMKNLVRQNSDLQENLGKADQHVRKLRVGNQQLSKILRDRDQTIKSMSVMFEDTMDLQKEDESPEEWRERLLNRHRANKMIIAPTMPRTQDSMLLEHIINEDPEKSLKKMAVPIVFHNKPEDEDLEDLVNYALWDRANPSILKHRNQEDIPVPHFHIKEDGTINQLRPLDKDMAPITESVLEADLAAYLNWAKSDDNHVVKSEPEIGTALHEMAVEYTELKKIPGVEPATTIMPVLEPLSLEEKEE